MRIQSPFNITLFLQIVGMKVLRKGLFAAFAVLFCAIPNQAFAMESSGICSKEYRQMQLNIEWMEDACNLPDDHQGPISCDYVDTDEECNECAGAAWAAYYGIQDYEICMWLSTFTFTLF